MTPPASHMNPLPDPPPPAIPDIDLMRRIGRGGFGEVWLGVNRATGGLKAVKVVPLARGGRTIDPAGREVVSLAQFESQRIGRHPPGLGIDPVEPPSLRECGADIEPPGKGLRRHVLGAFVL